MATNTTIAVTPSDKDLLDDVARDVFGDEDVPYRHTLSYLAINHIDNN